MSTIFIRETIKNKLARLLSHEQVLPPLVYFIAFIYQQFSFEQEIANIAYIEFVLGVGVLLACDFNLLFMTAPFIQCGNTALALAMLAVCLLCCN